MSSGPTVGLSGLVFAYDMYNVKSYIGAPATNVLPTASVNSIPTTGNSWGTYNTNQYNSNTYFSIGSISSVSGNIVTTAGTHPLRSYDVVTPQSSGGGLTAGVNYLIKKLSATTFSIHTYNSSQDGSQGYISSATGTHKVYDDFANDVKISINSTSFPTMWWGSPHLPNSGLVKEVRTNGCSIPGYPTTDCLRLYHTRPDGVTDGMAYNVDAPVTPSTVYTVSFWTKTVNSAAVGQSISYQIYNYTGGSATGFSFNATLGAVDVWVKQSMTFTPVYSTCISYWFPSSGNIIYDLAHIQFETGSVATDWTSSSRSTSQALLDLTNNGSTVANSLTYANDKTFSFNGSSNYFTVTPSAAFNLYCLEFWMYNNNAVPNNDSSIGGPSTYQSPVNFNSVGTYGINLGGWTSAATNEAFHIWSATAGGLMTYNQVAAAVGWHHVVFNWNGSTYDIWLDGVKTTTYAHSSGHAKLANITSLRIGGDVTSGYYFNGKLSSVKCYNLQLNDGVVAQNFNALRSRYGI
jgi:hypothetical protein